MLIKTKTPGSKIVTLTNPDSSWAQLGKNAKVAQSPPNEIDQSLPGWLNQDYFVVGSLMAALFQVVK